jgi:phenylalanyl-tRNA synthetase beta chain
MFGAGQNVALALAGARLVDGYSETLQYKTLKPGTIRGVRSEGMVCSEKELGLSGEHEGILVLEPEAPVGAPLAEWLGETVIEFEITPNLVHAFSVLGIGREAAAITGRPLRLPRSFDLSTAPAGAADLVRVDAPELCPRCVGVVIEGITVGPSPSWLARRLAAAGLRPINNVVDVTQYVMLDHGQPLHAYDRDRLAGGRIVVRRAEPGEVVETIDHQRRELSPDTLVIGDAERAVGIAGVMGGVDSEVADATTTVLLEAANFAMTSIRKTARGLKLRTDASARFERGLDPNLAGDAAARATQLLLDLCPDARVTGHRDVYPSPVEPRTLSLPFAKIERVLGVRYDGQTVRDALGRLGFAPVLSGPAGEARLTVSVPTYRQDVTLAEDVVEEIARIVGYETLPETLPTGRLPAVTRDPMHRLQTAVRELLARAGSAEAITYVTVSEAQLRALGPGDADGTVGFLHRAALEDLLRLRNPLQSDRGLLRPTLLPALLDVVAANRKHETGVRMHEVARVYLPDGDVLPREANVVALVASGQRDRLDRYAKRQQDLAKAAGAEVESWADGTADAASPSATLDFFDLKGAVEALLGYLGATDATFARPASPVAGLHPGRTAEVRLGETLVGLLGELRPDVAAAYGIEDERVAVAELDLDALLPAATAARDKVSVPRFLPVQQDFAVVVPEETPAAEVERALRSGAGPLATGVELFDVFRGEQLGDGKKSLAYRVTFTAPDRPLTDAELGKTRGRIAKVLAQRVAGTLRG